MLAMDQSWVILTPGLLTLQDKYREIWGAPKTEQGRVSRLNGNERHVSYSASDTSSLVRPEQKYASRALTRQRSTIPSRPSMDDIRAPNLAAKSLDLQTREVFNTLVSSILFPATYAAFYRRVDQDIIAFIRDDQQAQCPVMEWMVRCYATWYFAKQHNDDEKLSESRYVYGVLLQYFRRILLDDPRKRTADVTFTIAILLCIYEVLDSSAPDGWLVHIRGAKELLRQRGAAGCFSGFGRTILLACRGFFVGEALVSGEGCILAEPDWADINARAFEREEKAGRGSKLVTVVDQTYREIVRAPGLVAQARAVVDPGSGQGQGHEAEASVLRAEIQRSRGVLRRLMRRLACVSGMDATVTLEPTTPREKVSGLYLDHRYTPLIARYNLRGVCAVEALLGQAYSMLDKKRHNSSKNGNYSLTTISARICHDNTVREGLGEPPGSLDDLFLSLGAMTIRINGDT
ncbi:uncharacterized protein BDV17DRAFT_288098 [Aspergillus undulatus]|uniref:uncharacterized protein n=1 Tax=Aspergillus undulatus TaxID=1810928 RepID=UPI003CCDE63E